MPKLKIPGGNYLPLPSLAFPAFLLPVENQNDFRLALSLLTPKDTLAAFKIRVLQTLPLSWILSAFPTVKLKGDSNADSNQVSVLLPWNQAPDEKLTWITANLETTEKTVQKAGFSHRAQLMIKNEHRFLGLLNSFEPDQRFEVPSAVDFQDMGEFVFLMESYHDGRHIKKLPKGIEGYFESLHVDESSPLLQHPYFVSSLKSFRSKLHKNGFVEMSNKCADWVYHFRNQILPIGIQHGDFSPSNMLKTGADRYLIIDWEDAKTNSLPLDFSYFWFRRRLDRKEKVVIQGLQDFLSWFHYARFQLEKQQFAQLEVLQEQVCWGQI